MSFTYNVNRIHKQTHDAREKKEQKNRKNQTHFYHFYFSVSFLRSTFYFQLIFLCKCAWKKWPEKIRENEINKTNEKNRAIFCPANARATHSHSHYIFLFSAFFVCCLLPALFLFFHYKCVAGIRENIIHRNKMKQNTSRTGRNSNNNSNEFRLHSQFSHRFPARQYTRNRCISPVVRWHTQTGPWSASELMCAALMCGCCAQHIEVYQLTQKIKIAIDVCMMPMMMHAMLVWSYEFNCLREPGVIFVFRILFMPHTVQYMRCCLQVM